LSISLCIGVAAALGLAIGATLAVVIAGDTADMAGDMPGAGEIPATAGLIAETGAAVPAELAGGGGGWPKEVHASVTEQRLAISSVFIGLIGKFSPARIFDEDFPFVYPQSGKHESSKTFAFVVSTFGSWRTLH
jgi:hypothetical protein